MAGFLGINSDVGSPDISQQLLQVQQNAQRNRQLSGGLYNSLQPLTQQYQQGVGSTISGATNTANAAAGAYQGQVGQNVEDAKNALRSNLYGSTFNGLPAALTATREAAAAGGGVQSGSYQNAVKQIGVGTAQALATGEAGIQAQGAAQKTAATTTAYQTVQNLTSRLTDAQLSSLSTVLATGREDLIQNAATQMGLNDQETQSLIQLYNFNQSGRLASSAADASNNQQLLSNVLNIAGKAIASGGSGGSSGGGSGSGA
jgi:hypothetical protein